MADASRSASSPSKKLSNAGDLTSKHIYDGVISAPTATKLNSSTLSIRFDDYRDIFSPSDASLGSSIPILDLPAVDRSDVIDHGRSSGVDYAGVFGGFGDDDRVGVPAEVLFRQSKKKAKTGAHRHHRSRSSIQTKILDSKSQDLLHDSRNIQASKSPTKIRTEGSKGQEFCGGFRDYPIPSQALEIPTATRTRGSKSHEFCGSSRDNPTPSQASEIPTIARTMGSKSQEFCGTSRGNPTSSQASNIPTITRTTVSQSQELCGSSGENPNSCQSSKTPATTRTMASKSQELCESSGENPNSCQSSKTPATTRTMASKSQEFCGSSRDNPTSSQASRIPIITRTMASKSQEFYGSFRDSQASGEASKSATKTRMVHSKSQEFCGSSKYNPSSDESSHRQFDSITNLNVPHQKINQSGKDVTAGMAQIAHLHAVPGYTSTFEEVGPARKIGINKVKCVSMDDTDLGTDKQTSDHAHKEFDAGEWQTFEATHSMREGICKSQTFCVSSLSSSPPSFGSNDYFKRSSSQRSKRFTNYKQSYSASGSSSPLLELDVNSTAAVSASALKRAIEEAEAKILLAKEFLKGQECDQSRKLSLKDILKVKATSENGPLEVEARRQDKYGDEGKLPKQKGHLSTIATSENSKLHEAGALNLKDDLCTTESQLAGEASMLREKVHGVSAKEDRSTTVCVGVGSTCVAAAFKETNDSFAQEECVNDALLKEKANSQEVVKSIEKSHKQEGGGEWEAAKQLSQLISGVKNRFVSFISKQADIEKIVLQEKAPSSSGSMKMSEENACQVQDADAQTKRGTDQDNVEEDIQMNNYASSGDGETVHDSKIGMGIHKPEQNQVEITVDLEQRKVGHMTLSPGAKMLISRQYDLSEPEQEWEVQESVEVAEELKQEDQDHREEILNGYVACEQEKDELDTNECVEHDITQEAAHQSGIYGLKAETNCKDNKEAGKEVQDQEPIETLEESFQCKNGTKRWEEECSRRENKKSKGSVSKPEVSKIVEDTYTDEIQERVQTAEFNAREDSGIIEHQVVQSTSTVGVTEVADDTSEHGEKKLECVQNVEETCTDELQETVQAAELNLREDSRIIEHRDVRSKSNVGLTEFADGTSEHDEKKQDGVQMVEETCLDKLQERLHAAELNSREDNRIIGDQDVQSKSAVSITEVADDTFEHDEKKLEDVQMIEETCADVLQERLQAAGLNSREDDKIMEHEDVQSKSNVGITKLAEDAPVDDEFLVLNRNKEACLHDESSQYSQKLGPSSCGEEKMEEPATSPFDPKIDSEQPLAFSKNEEACVHNENNHYAQQLGSSSRGEDRIEEPCTSPFDSKVNSEQPLVISKNKVVCLHNESSQYTPHLGSSSGGEEEKLEEQATSFFEPKLHVVQQSICPQIATQPVKEDVREQKLTSFEVGDDVLEHDDCFPEMSHISEASEHGKPSTRGNEYTFGCNDTDHCSQDVEINNFEKDLEQPSSETKGDLEQPSSVHTINDLIQKEMYEQNGCLNDETDETLDHEEECWPSADICKKEVHSCHSEDNEGPELDVVNEHIQDLEFPFKNERITESMADISAEPDWNAEQPSSVQTATNLVGEDMTESSISDRSQDDVDVVEGEIEDTLEELPHSSFQKTQCKASVDFNEKHASEETFATQNNEETEVRTADMGQVDMTSDQDIRMHDAETSYKRKRWFENRDEAAEFDQSGILLGAKITLEVDQEKNTQGSEVDERVENNVDERVNASGEGTSVRQNDSTSTLGDGCHSTEAIHRRRRWFKNRGQEILHKPQIDDHITQESEFVEKLVNEEKKDTGVREDDVASDQVESKTTDEATHRRRRWFENEEGLGPQKLSIQKEETERGADAATQNELDEMSTANAAKNKQQKQLNNREKDKERERRAVERAIREARQRAFADAKERAAVEARQKSEVSSAQDRQGIDSSEAKSGFDKASMDAKVRAERAAVERATAEARERALQRAMSEKAASQNKEKDSTNQTSGTSCSSGYPSVHSATEKSSGVVSESPRRRRRAISERNKRTLNRAAKALEEKNIRDSLAQKEQAERNKFAEGLDADVKRWLSGKDGNLRAMLSTLQYILGPDSGWQPIPLTDLVTSTAVRKAYKRAALCVHPDKLQQRGATVEQKYVCEKVFDLLKDAWHRFNPDD